MTPPAPAAVRAALEMTETTASTESHRIIDEMAREKGSRPSVIVAQIVSDHIRAVAQEMRKESEEWYAASMKHGGNQAMTDHANDLEKFADKLEGKQNENT